MKLRITIAAMLTAALACVARAQDDPRILHSSSVEWESNWIGSALLGLGLGPHTTLIGASDQDLIDHLRAQEWDLVIVRWYNASILEAELAAELEAHIQRGGKVMLSIAQIEANRILWRTLGIAETDPLRLPLSRIIPPRDGFSDPSVRHPAFSSRASWSLGVELFGPDFGDQIWPAAGGYVIAEYEDDKTPAIIVARGGRVIVNGQEWDNWGGRGIIFAEDQISWLLACPADLDGDGEATVFDFLEFQNLFGAGDPRADVFFDGRLDLFDFLEFFNQFEHACR